MSNMGMVALLAGMGSGYAKGKQQRLDDERQAAMDKITMERAAREQEAYDTAKKEKAAIAAAGKPADVNTDGATLDTGDGPRAYGMQDASSVASSDLRQFQRNQQNQASMQQAAQPVDANAQPMPVLPGTAQPAAPAAQAPADLQVAPAAAPAFKPTMQSGVPVVNGVAQPDMATMQKTTAAYNSPEAKNERLAQAYESSGNPEKAMQLRASAQQLQLGGLQLDEAKQKHIDNEYERVMNKAVSDAGGDVAQGIANMLTKTQLTGDAKFSVERKDGKGVIVATGPDGTQKPVMQFDDTPTGHAALLSMASRATTDKKIAILFEVDKVKREEKQRTLEADHWDKTFKQNDDHFQQNKELQRLHINIAGAQLKIAQNADKRAQAAFDIETKMAAPDKMAYKSLEDEHKAISTAIYKASTDGTLQPDNKAFQALLEKQASIGIRMDQILSKYPGAKKADGAAPKPADPLGILGQAKPAGSMAAAAAPAPAAAPAAPAQTMQATAKGPSAASMVMGSIICLP